MIKLVNICKYYHDESSVVLGLHKINCEFNKGEFIAITGESGSGKTTLLNVISGVDTYEDGELYIDGNETSFYTQDDLEEYRRNRVGFIFQNYNLIDSYSVYENVESAMIIQGVKNRKEKALDIIKKVGLEKQIKQKATKLSGGQRQRLAIARALAKETDMIVADEPTGNLDSESGKEIIKLLYELSQDKLVIIVTHNYDEVSPYITRSIRLVNGEIIEDKEIRKRDNIDHYKEKPITEEKLSSFSKGMIFSLLNLKGQPKRTILLLLVTFMMSFFVTCLIGLFLGLTNEIKPNKLSSIYQNVYPERLIVTKENKDAFITEEIENIEKLPFCKAVNPYDLSLEIQLRSKDPYLKVIYFNTSKVINSNDLLYGRLPEKDDEGILYTNMELDELIERYYMKYIDCNSERMMLGNIKIVGFTTLNYSEGNNVIYVSDAILKSIASCSVYLTYNPLMICYSTIKDEGVYYKNPLFVYYKKTALLESLPNNTVGGKIDFTKDYNYFVITDQENQINYEILDLEDSVLYLSSDLYKKYARSLDSQIAINLIKYDMLEEAQDVLSSMGYLTVSPYETTPDSDLIINLVQKIFYGFVCVMNILLIYLVGYLVIKLILLSKKKDYNILREVGIEKNTVFLMSKIEILICYIVSFILVLLIFVLLRLLVTSRSFSNILMMFKFKHFLIIGLINLLLSLMVSWRFNKLLIKQSILNAIKEE